MSGSGRSGGTDDMRAHASARDGPGHSYPNTLPGGAGLICYECGYGLEGVRGLRCPECGKPIIDSIESFQNEWARELLRPMPEIPGPGNPPPRRVVIVAWMVWVHVYCGTLMGVAGYEVWRGLNGHGMHLAWLRTGLMLPPAATVVVMAAVGAFVAFMYVDMWRYARAAWRGERTSLTGVRGERLD